MPASRWHRRATRYTFRHLLQAAAVAELASLLRHAHPRYGRSLARPLAIVALTVGAACHRAAPDPAAGPAASSPPASARADVSAAADPYHPPPRDTVEVPLYQAWQQYSLQCARCHGEDAQGSSFGPSLLEALKPGGDVPTKEEFLHVLGGSRSEKGMPSAAKMGLDSVYFDGLYAYLKGRSEGRFHGGRPARRES